MRHAALLTLLAAVTLAPAGLPVADAPAASVADARVAPDVPREALEAMQQGRYLHASLILREYLSQVSDTAPRTLLLAARAEAGWDNWARVASLLDGRPWLDSLGAGLGWKLLGRSRIAEGQSAEGARDLEHYLGVATATGARERGMIQVRRGRALDDAGDEKGALAAYRAAAGLVPQIGDWISYLSAEAAAGAGDTAAVRRALSGLPPALSRDRGWSLRVKAREKTGDPAGALAVARAAAREASGSWRRAEAWEQAGELHLSMGDTETARTAFRRAIEEAPRGSAAIDAARNLTDLPGLTPEDHLAIGRIYLRAGNLERGTRGLDRFLGSGKASAAERLRIHHDIAMALFRAGRYSQAALALRKLAAATSSRVTASEALYDAARAEYRRGRVSTARTELLHVARRYPSEAAGVRSLWLLADLDHDAGRVADARRLYREVVRSGLATDEVGKAYMRLGSLAYVEGDMKEAARIYEQYRRRFPHGQRYDEATYWAGKADRALGRDSLANARLESLRRSGSLSYYAARAASLLDEPFWELHLDASPPADSALRDRVESGLVPVDLLRELGLDGAAAYELDRLKHRFARPLAARYALAEALNERGYTVDGIQLGWEIRHRVRAWNGRLLRIVYPFPYRDIVLAEARDREIDPNLVAAIIRQESMFKAGAVSGAGAVGLMQVLPGTGGSIARQMGIRSFDTDMLERPEVNIHLGIAFLADLLATYDGNLPAVLAAYNAGPSRVDRWKQFPEYRDGDLFSERIPYDETRDYVKIVQRNARIYAALYPGPAEGDQPGD